MRVFKTASEVFYCLMSTNKKILYINTRAGLVTRVKFSSRAIFIICQISKAMLKRQLRVVKEKVFLLYKHITNSSQAVYLNKKIINSRKSIVLMKDLCKIKTYLIPLYCLVSAICSVENNPELDGYWF